MDLVLGYRRILDLLEADSELIADRLEEGGHWFTESTGVRLRNIEWSASFSGGALMQAS